MSREPPRSLKQERFVQAIVSGEAETLTAAARSAGYKDARGEGSRLMSRGKVA